MVLFLLSIDRREGYFFEIFWEHPYPKSPPPLPGLSFISLQFSFLSPPLPSQKTSLMYMLVF